MHNRDEEEVKFWNGISVGSKPAVGVLGVLFLPSDLPGLKLWLDFSDVSTLYQDSALTTPVTADNDVIGGVVDKAGNNNATGTTTDRPAYKVNQQNGRSGASFNGTENKLLVTLSSAYTVGDIFMVVKALAVGTGYALHIKNHDGGLTDTVSSASISNTASNQFRYEATVISTTAWNDSAWRIIRFDIASGAQQVFINGVSAGTGTKSNAQSNVGVAVGNHQGSTNVWDAPFAGVVGELLIYNAALSATQRSTVQNYLNHKWSIY